MANALGCFKLEKSYGLMGKAAPGTTGVDRLESEEKAGLKFMADTSVLEALRLICNMILHSVF